MFLQINNKLYSESYKMFSERQEKCEKTNQKVVSQSGVITAVHYVVRQSFFKENT